VTIVGFVPAEACRREASGLLTGNLVGHPARPFSGHGGRPAF